MTADTGGARVCMFCGARPLTKTHLIAQRAIRRHLPSSDSDVTMTRFWPDPVGGAKSHVQTFDSDPLSQQVKQACEVCNRDWMGGIENDVAADVIALAKGSPVILDEQRSSRLAVWAAVVAMLRASQDAMLGPTPVTTAEAHFIREHEQLPSGWVVWLIHGVTRWEFPTRHSRFASLRDDPAIPHMTYFWIGSSVYLVSHPAMAEKMSRMNILGSAAQILAPYGDYPIAWPFGNAVQKDTMHNLTTTLFSGAAGAWRGFEPREG